MEARWGQRLRGGRSWPSDWNVSVGAMKAGKVTTAATVDGSTEGIALKIGVIEQKVAQMPQPPAWPAEPDGS